VAIGLAFCLKETGSAIRTSLSETVQEA